MAFGNTGLTKRILHVDDDPLILDLVQATFRNDKAWSVTSLNNAEDALAFIHNLKPDLIIVDIAMSNMGGFEFILELRKIPETELTPIIILSGRARSLGRHNPFQEMAVVVLEKPLDPDRLHYEAERALARASLDKNRP